jgi:hypothetical protein
MAFDRQSHSRHGTETLPVTAPFILFICQSPYCEEVRDRSDVGVAEALDAVLRYAKLRAIKVAVAPYPATSRSMAMLRERTLGSPMGHWIDNVPILTCIEQSQRVFTVNSEAGLDAIRLGRTVIRFGRSDYDDVTALALPAVDSLIDLEAYTHDPVQYERLANLHSGRDDDRQAKAA